MADTAISPLKAVLLDIQGTLLAGDGTPIAGAAQAVESLKAAGLAVRFVTNIDSVTVATILARLKAAGIQEVFTPGTSTDDIVKWIQTNVPVRA
jgi:ribonucleotide monophosphatase NagD (HAD superfamily)